MRLLWPESFAGRVALVLVSGLLLVQLASFAWFLADQTRATMRAFRASAIDRMAATVSIAESLPTDERTMLARAVSGPGFEVAMLDAPPFANDAQGWLETRIRKAFARRDAGGMDQREIRLRIGPDDGEEWRRNWDDRPGGPEPPDRPSRHQRIDIAVAAADGLWVVFTLPASAPPFRWAFRLFGWVLLSCGVLAAVAILAARRLAQPLRTFAEAAERLGTDVAAPPLPETGAREVKAAARAFNNMQARIRHLVEDRTRVLAAISHDLRTALTRLRLRTDFIEDDVQRQKAEGDLASMEAMLAATLGFAKDAASGEAPVEMDLAALVESACADFGDAGHDATYAGPERLTFTGRPVGLRRAIDNLIQNALAYAGAAEVTLADVDGAVEIVVADRGPGIPAEAMDRVFDPFYRLEESRSRDTGGTGLGLTVARSIARAHGGDIRLETRDSGGLRAVMRLPRAT